VSARPLTVVTLPGLGSAATFAVLGGTKVGNTGPTGVNGDLGVYPGLDITGLADITVIGVVHQGDAVAQQAQIDIVTAYNSLAGQLCQVDMTSQDLGGLTLTQGVYCFSSTAGLTGTLTLDAQGDPSAIFVFQVGSQLATSTNSSVDLVNGASFDNVFWQVGSYAIFGANSTFVGNILALDSITLNNGASIVSGRALARNGTVTLNSNTITVPAPGAFTKTSPVNSATGQPTDLILSWGTSSIAASYEFCINTTSCTALSTWYSTGTNTSVGLGGLNSGATYIWQVRAGNLSGNTFADDGISWSFTTINPYKIFLPLVIRN
jgi:Ice-binding-like